MTRETIIIVAAALYAATGLARLAVWTSRMNTVRKRIILPTDSDESFFPAWHCIIVFMIGWPYLETAGVIKRWRAERRNEQNRKRAGMPDLKEAYRRYVVAREGGRDGGKTQAMREARDDEGGQIVPPGVVDSIMSGRPIEPATRVFPFPRDYPGEFDETEKRR